MLSEERITTPPVTRILAATDGSPPAQRALRWAAGLAAATGALLDVVYAWSPDQSELPPLIAKREERRAQTRLAEYCRPLREAGAAHIGRAVEGDPRQVLPDEAEHTRPDLVVIGSRRENAAFRIGVGAVARHLSHVHPPLVVARQDELRAGSVVVGVDGSDANLSAVQWAAALAVQLGRPLEAVYAAMPAISGSEGAAPTRWHFRGEEEVRAELAPIRADSGDFRLTFVAEEASLALERIAGRDDAAAIVVGTRGRGSLHGALLGTVPTGLVHRGTRPVILVPHHR